jgi:hypothetical protein
LTIVNNHYTALLQLHGWIATAQLYHYYTAVLPLHGSVITVQLYHHYTALSSLHTAQYKSSFIPFFLIQVALSRPTSPPL